MQRREESASNLQDDIPMAVLHNSSENSTRMVDSKRTGEGDWEEDIQSEVFFQN